MRASGRGLAVAGLLSVVCVVSAWQPITATDLVQDRGAQGQPARARALIHEFDECLQQRFKDRPRVDRIEGPAIAVGDGRARVGEFEGRSPSNKTK